MEELFKSLSESVSEECYNEILEIVEEIINEVSMKKWVNTATAVLPYRAAKAKSSSEKQSALATAYHLLNPKSIHKDNIKQALIDAGEESRSDLARLGHAKTVAKLLKGSGSASANKTIKAANKVATSRDEKLGPGNKRASHATYIAVEDPVVSRTKPDRHALPPTKEK